MSLALESLQDGFQLHKHSIYPSRNVIIGPIGEQNIEPKAMQVLLFLASQPNVVIPRNEFMEQVWPGTVIGEEVLTRCISLLRSVLKENNQHNYIETVSKSGYRLVAPVKALSINKDDSADKDISRKPTRIINGLVLVTVFLIIIAGYYYKTFDHLIPDAKVSIAVLPFLNMSSDPEQEYFSDGMTEELLNLLSKIPQLDVIARTSSFSFKGKDNTIAEIAKKLKVAYVMEGSVRKSGNRLKITAQLIEAETEIHLWSETYERELKDIFAVQDEISAAIVKQLKEKLGIEIDSEKRDMASVNLDAHTEYMQGLFYIGKRTHEDLNRALAHFDKAIAIDPNYALAWMGKAWAHLLTSEFEYGFQSGEKSLENARPNAEKAILLDPLLPEAQAIRGRVEQVAGNNEKAIVYYQKAIELNPNYADAYIWYSKIDLINRFELRENAVQLDPMNLHVNSEYGRLLIDIQRFDKATEVAIHMLDIDNSSDLAYGLLRRISEGEGKTVEALLYHEKQVQLNPAVIPSWTLRARLKNYGFKERTYLHYKGGSKEESAMGYEDGIVFEWVKTYMNRDFEQYLLITREIYPNDGSEHDRGRNDSIAFYRFAQAELYAGNYSEAIKYFTKANRKDGYYIVYCYQQLGDFESANKTIDKWGEQYKALIKAGRENIESFGAMIAFAENDIDKMVEFLNSQQQRDMKSILEFEYNHLPMYQKLREHPRWISLLAESDKRATKIREAYFELAKQDVEVVARAHKSKKSIPNIEVKVTNEILKEYVGVYKVKPIYSNTVSLEKGILIIQTTNKSRFKLLPDSESTFFTHINAVKYTFQRDANGDVVSMIRNRDDGSQHYKRVNILEESP